MSKKIKIKISIRLFAYSFICILFLASVSHVNAQSEYPEGITVIPSVASVDLALDAPVYDLTYINNTASTVNLELSVQDFTQLEESYKISFLEGKDAENYKYSLSSWLSFSNENLNLAPGEEKSVKVFIDDDRITLGGHYASILARVTQENIKEQININPVISSLLFVRASTGREIENGDISTFRPDRSLFNFPENFVLRFENSGNVHVIPYGEIIITDMLGNQAARGVLNEGSLNALPESIRRYDIPIKNSSKFLIPGIYTAKIDMHYGNSKKELSRTTIFFSEGSVSFVKSILIILTILIVVIILRRRIKAKKKKKEMK